MKKNLLVIAIIGSTLFCGVVAFTIYKHYIFKKGCEDYLKLAADAPTLERAKNFTEQAINYIESKNLTTGNSGIIFKTPSNDLELWYGQIKAAYVNIVNIIEQDKLKTGSISQLTKDNMLMKLREVLVDVGDDDTEITLPKNITIYPNQVLICIWWIIALIMSIGGWVSYFSLYKKIIKKI